MGQKWHEPVRGQHACKCSSRSRQLCTFTALNQAALATSSLSPDSFCHLESELMTVVPFLFPYLAKLQAHMPPFVFYTELPGELPGGGYS